ncbi:chloroplast envelope quinone oxidoreductase homolog [Selaginella moellendorffii]|nr:chloroplast envelope quinone oxidoreductase homolog [Selaginella moellendorffii]|eukprot:XP_002978323.2 chloroplast envelope quinone oxidoreductase homolog [Selaginella moellendorffii]
MEMQGSMPVIQYVKFGGDLEKGHAPVPSPGPGELLVKVQAASLNPVDWKIQQGKYKTLNIPAQFPYIPCSDISGEVVSLGPGVTGFSVGDKVVSYLDHKRGGGLAKYASAEVRFTTRIPSQISPIEAAGLPIAGLTALYSLQEAAGIAIPSKDFQGTILVTAASGGVGTYAVQLAKLTGAHVVATCGSRNIDLIKSLGADEVLDYKTPQGAKLQSSSCSKFDVIIHCAYHRPPWSTFEHVLTRKGIVVDITPASESTTSSLKRKFDKAVKLITSQEAIGSLVPLYLTPHTSGIEALVDMMQKGKLKTIIDSVHPISNVTAAWFKCMEGHATGKIVVTL